MKIREIDSAIQEWAPHGTAQSYDNVGLQIGDADRDVSRVLVAVDLTPAVIREAIDDRFELIVTHHPLLFKPLKSLTTGSLVSAMALKLAESGIALYSAHTNLDAAQGGVSYGLAEQLGLTDIGFLAPLDGRVLKLVTFVPETHEASIREALAAAGAGRIGDYDACAFTSRGTGFFHPGANSTPFIGEVTGVVQSADEFRVEVEVADWRLDDVVAALKKAHPYEEVAYDVYEVRQPFRGAGLGAVGSLPEPLTTGEFLDRVSNRLDAPTLRYSGPDGLSIEHVAVCGGSGSDLLPVAVRAGAQAFVTADVTYHRYFDVYDATGESTILLVDAGHYETERVTERLIAELLGREFPEIVCRVTRNRTGPMQHYYPGRTEQS